MTDRSEFDPDRPPIRGRYGSHPILDLNGVPEEHWAEVLPRFHPNTYGSTLAGFTPNDSDTLRRAMIAIGQARLDYGRDDLYVPDEAWAHPPGLPTPEPRSARARRGRRQVNFRLGPERYRRLVRAAELMNLSPTQLAGLLVVRGVDQILREARPRG